MSSMVERQSHSVARIVRSHKDMKYKVGDLIMLDFIPGNGLSTGSTPLAHRPDVRLIGMITNTETIDPGLPNSKHTQYQVITSKGRYTVLDRWFKKI